MTMEPSEVLMQLEDFGFKPVLDYIGEYAKGAHLYFLKIDIERYIIFHHVNHAKSEDLQSFHCWIGTYKFTEFIGKVPAIELEEVKQDFDFVADWKLLAEHMSVG